MEPRGRPPLRYSIVAQSLRWVALSVLQPPRDGGTRGSMQEEAAVQTAPAGLLAETLQEVRDL